jgi:Family of unknown function (DUF5898)
MNPYTDNEYENRLATVTAELQSEARREESRNKMRLLGEDQWEDFVKKHDMDEKQLQFEFVCKLRGEKVPYLEAMEFLKEAGITDIKLFKWDGLFPVFRWKEHPDKRQQPHQATLLYSIGSGRTGQCWLTVTEEGCICVTKVFIKHRWHSFQQLWSDAKIECEGWNKIYCKHLEYKESELVRTPDGDVHLRMPYIRALADTAQGELRERRRLLREGCDGALGKALRFFVEQGYRHPSIKWKHVGRESTDPESKIIFFDLGLVEKPSRWDKEAWVQQSIRNLRSEM